MALTPNIPKNNTIHICEWCGQPLPASSFISTKSPFFQKGISPMCTSCIKDWLIQKEFQWQAVDRLCQYLDIPFIPKEFERLHAQCGDEVFSTYAAVFLSTEYTGLGWDDYYKAYLQLREENLLA